MVFGTNGKISWTERITNEYVLNQVRETKSIMNVIKWRWWHMMGYVLRHVEKLQESTIEEQKLSRSQDTRIYFNLEKT